MTGARENLNIPRYYRNFDMEQYYRDYPPPEVFCETVYKWPRDRIRELQDRRFKEVVALGWKNPFYQKRWKAAGLEPGDIRGLDDVTKLPLFNSEDIKLDQQEHPPYGEIQGVTLADSIHTPLKLHTSGGTTGRARPTLFGPREWEMNSLAPARLLYNLGARAGDVMQIPSTLSLANLGWAFYQACHYHMGIMPITTGSGVVTSSRRQLEIAFEFGTNLWISFPEYLTQLAKVCRDELGRDVRELKTKFISTFLGPDLDGSLRKMLEETWGCPVYDNYGTHEVSGGGMECQAKNGLHFMEDTMYLEVVDVDTGKPVKNGQSGNLVATVFYRRIPLLIRYNLRDLVRIISEDRCTCGSCFRRMDHFLGRSDAMVKLRGVNMYPMACLTAVKSDPRTTGEWLCVADRITVDGVLRDEMTVRVEVRDDAGGTDGLKEHLERRLHSDLAVKVAVELVPEGSLAKDTNVGGEGKAKRLLDRRYGEARS